MTTASRAGAKGNERGELSRVETRLVSVAIVQIVVLWPNICWSNGCGIVMLRLNFVSLLDCQSLLLLLLLANMYIVRPCCGGGVAIRVEFRLFFACCRAFWAQASLDCSVVWRGDAIICIYSWLLDILNCVNTCVSIRLIPC